jgi:hypothetical protein
VEIAYSDELLGYNSGMAERVVRGWRRAVGLALTACGVVALVVSSTSCSTAVDLKQVLEVTDLSGGYWDAGIVDGKNKLQPMVTFRLVRKGDRPDRLSLNVHFRQIVGSELQEFNEVYLQTVEFGDDGRTEVITARTNEGYTGDPPQSRADMLKNPHFRDMRAIVFARQSSGNWVELATFDLPRQVLTR